MIDHVITAMLLIVAFIHLAPISGALGEKQLEKLYGVSFASPDLQILMRHRAVLFGILGLFFAHAAFTPALQPLAFLAALASLASFFYLAFSVGNYNPGIRKVIVADVIASVALAIAVVLYYFGR